MCGTTDDRGDVMSYQFVTQEELDQQKKYTIDQFIRDVAESKRVGMSLVDLDGGLRVPFRQCDEPGCTKLSAMESKCPDHVPMTVDQRETLENIANVQVGFTRQLTNYDRHAIKKALQLIDKLDAENERLRNTLATHENIVFQLREEQIRVNRLVRDSLSHLQTI
jgi:hypothetical protein